MAMMECPRCGFVQPKDRYCANCGLDVEHYTPKPEPFFSKLAKSPFLYISAACVLVLGLVLFLSKAPKSNLDQNAEVATAVSDAPAPAAPSETAVQKPAPPETSSERSTSPPSEPSPTTPSASETLNSKAEESTAAPLVLTEQENSTDEASASSTFSQLEFSFFEFPREALLAATRESRVLSETDQYRILLHSNISNLEPLLNQTHKLPGTKATGSAEGAHLFVNFEMSSTETDLSGLNVDVALNNVSPVGVRLELQGSLQTGDSRNNAQFSVQPSLTPTSSLLIVGLIPRNLNLENDTYSDWKRTPLRIVESPDFREGLSEFVMLIRLK